MNFRLCKAAASFCDVESAIKIYSLRLFASLRKHKSKLCAAKIWLAFVFPIFSETVLAANRKMKFSESSCGALFYGISPKNSNALGILLILYGGGV